MRERRKGSEKTREVVNHARIRFETPRKAPIVVPEIKIPEKLGPLNDISLVPKGFEKKGFFSHIRLISQKSCN